MQTCAAVASTLVVLALLAVSARPATTALRSRQRPRAAALTALTSPVIRHSTVWNVQLTSLVRPLLRQVAVAISTLPRETWIVTIATQDSTALDLAPYLAPLATTTTAAPLVARPAHLASTVKTAHLRQSKTAIQALGCPAQATSIVRCAHLEATAQVESKTFATVTANIRLRVKTAAQFT